MRSFGKWLGRVLFLVALVAAALWAFGPSEPVDVTQTFTPTEVPDWDAHLAGREGVFNDITEGAEKRVIWAGEPNVKTPISVVYIHGFSATSEEIRPVPDNVAAALGANLYFARLAGHGRDGDAFAQASVADWVFDFDEAMEIGRSIGNEVLIISTSTGGTLTALMASHGRADDVTGLVFVSPNFALNHPAAAILTWPAVRYWGPVLMGENRSFETVNDGHEKYWTHAYPSVAALPMAALVKETYARDYSDVSIPALFVFSDDDQVVSPSATRDMIARWGGATSVYQPELTPGDDSYSHVIAGDILSPNQTAGAVAAILNWQGQK